jgi:FlaA1/EpsC-like NDP-sugar epimerase
VDESRKNRRPSSSTWWAALAERGARVRGDLLLAVLDATLFAAAFTFVLVLRFDGTVPTEEWARFRSFVPMAVGIALLSSVAWGLYGQLWRHASMQEARRLLLSGCTTLVVLGSTQVFRSPRMSLQVVVFGVVLGTFFLGALRFQSRLFSFRRRTATPVDGLRVIVIGAGDTGAALVRDMLRSPRAGLIPVAVLDDDPRRHGRSFMGLRIQGGIEDLSEVVEQTRAHQAVLAISSANNDTVQRAAAAAERAGVALRIAPSMKQALGAGVSVRDVRDIEIEDLLGRNEVATDLDGVRRLLAGRRVLITGAGGSIGSEIARQVAACDPAELVLLDNDETHLFDAATSIDRPLVQVLADIREGARINAVFAEHRPEVVFHAAAHKHVPLLEDHPCEAVSTNVVGTDHVLDAANAVGTRHLVFVSTDKAVRPSSVMGASKRLGEQLMLAKAPAGASYCAVRFGNVLGSRGSVIPTFMRQIQAGGPVTVTDRRMTRFFMSIPEACQLVLQAAALADGGEIFMLDMGEPVQIVDLAERMIRLSGRRVGQDIEIKVTGVRPGEKLCEELRTPDELQTPTEHPSITRLQPTLIPAERLEEALVRLKRCVLGLDGTSAGTLLFDLVGAERAEIDITGGDSVVDLTTAGASTGGHGGQAPERAHTGWDEH